MAGGRRVRLSDVARAAGVSPTTASHAFSGHRPVSPATRKAVLQAAFELGYTGAEAAHRLTVGLLIRPPEAIPGLAFGTTSLAAETGATVLALLGEGFSVTAMNGLEDVGEQLGWLDGFVLLAPNRCDPVLEVLRARDIPTVTYEEPVGVADFDWWVGNDFVESSAKVVRHLHAAGARRVALVAGLTDNAYQRKVISGYLAEVRHVGHSPMLRRADPARGGLAGRRAAGDLLASATPPDAILATSGVFAVAALEEANGRGLAVPDDLLVAATMDGPLGAHARVPITALRSNANDLAHAVAGLMTSRLSGGVPPALHDKVVLELAVRLSTTR
ncbi:substrate-binding domain-containing protein [Pseudonocardia halophobica]|uniref:Transcriptional regulator n=1 Tax=Pseudonocardia halophobica TaxID=29401 RepID=A0A9W6L5J5_9PSEU|nr:LacI family DNA-binding transcriptional regulator [Pseudonocardia halophobica]GLL14026.1 transcriptional regulator [Pseudonocardia halophobica]